MYKYPEMLKPRSTADWSRTALRSHEY